MACPDLTVVADHRRTVGEGAHSVANGSGPSRADRQPRRTARWSRAAQRKYLPRQWTGRTWAMAMIGNELPACRQKRRVAEWPTTPVTQKDRRFQRRAA